MKSQREKAGQIYGQQTGELNGQIYRMEKINTKADLSIGTWSALSLYHAGALNMLLDQLNNYREGTVALHKMRWTGKR
jgi:ribosome maturation protein Sdo1